MEINKSIKSETSFLLNARRDVIIAFVTLVFWLFIAPFFIHQYLDYKTYSSISSLLITIYAFICGRLYNIISKNILVSVVIGIFIIVLSWFAMGIGTIILTIFLLIKASNVLKKKESN